MLQASMSVTTPWEIPVVLDLMLIIDVDSLVKAFRAWLNSLKSLYFEAKHSLCF